MLPPQKHTHTHTHMQNHEILHFLSTNKEKKIFLFLFFFIRDKMGIEDFEKRVIK